MLLILNVQGIMGVIAISSLHFLEWHSLVKLVPEIAGGLRAEWPDAMTPISYSSSIPGTIHSLHGLDVTK